MDRPVRDVFICIRWWEGHRRGKAVRSALKLDSNGFTCVSAWCAGMLGVVTSPWENTLLLIGF